MPLFGFGLEVRSGADRIVVELRLAHGFARSSDLLPGTANSFSLSVGYSFGR